MSGLCASEGGYVATSQADYGTLNHAERIKKKTAFYYSSESKAYSSILSYFYENKANKLFLRFSYFALYISDTDDFTDFSAP